MPVEEVLRLRTDVEAIKSALGEALVVGTVTEVDPQRGYRIDLGEGTEGPMVSPWLPHPESGGQTDSWVPLSKGQIVGLFSPSGDLRQGVLLRAGFGGDNQPPSQSLQENVLEAFGVRITMRDGNLIIEGDLIVEGNVDFKDGHVQHNDTDIGDTHRHDESMPGDGLTGEPVDGS